MIAEAFRAVLVAAGCFADKCSARALWRGQNYAGELLNADFSDRRSIRQYPRGRSQ
jgi:hypothetical protein